MFTAIFGNRIPSECCMRRRLCCIALSLCLFVLFSVSYAADLSDGLINYWPLDGDATDSVGNKDGEVIGAPNG